MAELQRQKVYKKVFDMATADMAALDLREQALSAGVALNERGGRKRVTVPFFDEAVTIETPGFLFKSSKSASVSLVTKIILLHYLIRATGEPLGGERIPYEDIPGTRQYAPVFASRVTTPLARAFGYNRDAFMEAGLALSGKREDFGSASFTLFALPKIPITFILWEGDEEFRPTVKALFDPTIAGYLPLEDIVVVSKLASARIVKAARMKYAEEVME